MGNQQGTAFITTRKGFCYLTIKCSRKNAHIMRIRQYTIDAEDKRHMRRLYPNIVFDWKKITRQLAEKREVCRDYRSRRIEAAAERRKADSGKPFPVVYDPLTRTVYANGVPSTAAGVGMLLDAVLHADHALNDTPSSSPVDKDDKLRLSIKPSNF
ncbi:hypothetical protein [Scytonema sp. NUACC26]|uniref:hypothetical protein n=1 Tax=Scytonema sp. NUACC26 TaxID=3140176 RepID=UPI0034DBB33C